MMPPDSTNPRKDPVIPRGITSVEIKPELLERLDRVVQRRTSSRSAVIREAVLEWLERDDARVRRAGVESGRQPHGTEGVESREQHERTAHAPSTSNNRSTDPRLHADGDDQLVGPNADAAGETRGASAQEIGRAPRTTTTTSLSLAVSTSQPS